MAGNPQVLGLLEEMLGAGKTPEEVCRDCPELLPEVRRRWQEFQLIDAQFRTLLPGLATRPAPGPAAPPAAGLPEVPGYEVEAVLGRGGMGVVYRARHLALKRTVALKMLLSGAYAGPQELARFQREAEAVAGLRHPNIVQVYDVGDHEGRPYFTMEFVEGGTLAEKLAGAPQPPRQAAALVATLAGAVRAAHQGGVVHRDLKPANVLLTADGTPKISDFGLARRLTGEAGLTQSGAILGTPNYMAPEQARGKALASGPATDTYALGAILYELVTGRPPFEGATAADILLRVTSQEPTPPARLNAKVPRDLETICLKCLHKEPHRRYAGAAELAEDLRRFLQGEAIAARPEGRVERLARGVRRRPAVAVAATAGALLLAALAGGALWVSRERSETARAQGQLDRLEGQRREQAFAARLDAIHLNRAAVVKGRYYNSANKARADREYEAAFREAGFGEVHDDPALVSGRVTASTVRPALVAALDDWAFCAAGSQDAGRLAWLLEVARRADPAAPAARQRLRDPAAWKDRAALKELASSALEAKASPALLVALGEQLRSAGEDTVPFLSAVQQEHEGDFWANFALGLALTAERPGEAIRYYQAALAVRPGAAVVHNSLGHALLAVRRIDEAIEQFHRALRTDPEFAFAHTNLGVALDAKGRPDEAIEHYRQALQIDPQLATAHYDFGNTLDALGRKDEALKHFEQAVALDPAYADAHNNLGIALAEAGRRDEAVEHFRQAVALDPKLALAHCNLGLDLLDRGRPGEAIDHFRQAIAAEPGLAQAHGDLGRAMLAAGRFRDARAATRRCLDLLPAAAPRRAGMTRQLEQCDRLLALEARLPAVLRGEAKPAGAAERLQFAEVCCLKQIPAAATEMFGAAFADAPALADDLGAGHRYNAACAAALAGSARGEDAGKLGDEQRRRLRKQALGWLRADLLAWGKKLESDRARYQALVRRTLTHWRVDPDLDGIRGEAALEKLSADERRELLAFWNEVGDLLGRTRESK